MLLRWSDCLRLVGVQFCLLLIESFCDMCDDMLHSDEAVSVLVDLVFQITKAGPNGIHFGV